MAIYYLPRLARWMPLPALLLSAALAAQPIVLAEIQIDSPKDGDGATADNFGAAVAAFGDTLVVGTPGDVIVAPGVATGIEQGSAYLFRREGQQWQRERKFTASPVGEDGDAYGRTLVLGQDLLVIAAPNRRVGMDERAGAVFVYRRSGRQETFLQRLEAPQPAAEQRFGQAMALSGDTLAVATPGGNRVEIYRDTGSGPLLWQATLQSPDDVQAGVFGSALALHGDELLIGDSQHPGGGAVYRALRVNGAWTAATKLALTAPGASAEMGASLALDGQIVLVGMPGFGSGEVMLLLREGNGWTSAGSFAAADSQTGDRFGSAIALSASRAVIAAATGLQQEGSVYVYPRNGTAFASETRLDMVAEQSAARFGMAVGVLESEVLVGADREHINSNLSQGAVRVYQPQGGGWILQQRLDSGDGAYLDRYGISLSVSNDLAIVGAFLEDTQVGPDAGRAHWFQRGPEGWMHAGVLEAPDGAIEDRFGIAVATDGVRAVVGAYWDVVGDNVDQGSAYVFRREGAGWVFEAKLTAADGRPRDYFGFAVDIDGDTVVVGARGAATPFLEQGSAYVYRLQQGSWLQAQQLLSPQNSPRVYFGASVAIDGEHMVIGAPGAQGSVGVSGAGAAWRYRSSGETWVLQSVLRAPEERENAAFGFSVAADAGRMLIGAFQDSLGSGTIGAGYVFRSADGSLEERLNASQPQPGESLGIAVALSKNIAVLGASGFDLGSMSNSGSVRVFERGPTGWQEQVQIVAVDAASGDVFGRAVAAAPGLIAIGAPNKSRDNPLEGAAYLYLPDALFGDGLERH